MPETVEELRKQLEFFKTDPERKAYFALVRIVNMQVEYLNDFNIKSNIGGKASEDATFARTQGIWENLPKMISSLNELKSVLRITQEEEKAERKKAYSPESIADAVGELAGRLS